ncbi:TOP2A [Symbiodinium sp. CCMP2456]|nr:TOP2A [Symbiodinium sp. CCMP2456]
MEQDGFRPFLVGRSAANDLCAKLSARKGTPHSRSRSVLQLPSWHFAFTSLLVWQVYVPELVFGHLLTSDNYDDSSCKVVGGRNGYGAKLANVFSTEFKVETCDGKNRFSQLYKSNMQVKGKPEILATKEKSFTCITFKPDLAKFGMARLDEDIVSLLTKRVYDVAGSTAERCSVFLNGEKLDVKNFRDYCDLYLLTRQGVPQIYEKCSDRWEICVSLTETGFHQVSFVNSICTIRGGTHVTHVSDQVVEAILEKVRLQSKEKMKGGVDVRPHHVKNHLWIFIKCLVENPAFDSQTKETLMTKQSKFGSRCELSEKFLSEVATCGVVDLILMAAMAKSKVDLGKKLKANTSRVARLTGVPKLEDANDAGGKLSSECTLILTEGDSAKALAVAGLSVIGRDKWGVFPLRGKVLNVRDATLKQMMANEEIQNLIKIIGLDLNREYDAELKGLRYGSIMIMADQDSDGSHIKGLLINLIHAWWPSLARLPGFLKEFFTPIVKARKGRSETCFYTLPEYEAWKKETENGKGFKIKYYKGLGTSTSKEAKEYFSALESHKMQYRYDGVEDDRAIDLAFNKRRADDRKAWINAYEEGRLVDHTQQEVSYKDFVDKELVLFAKANAQSSAQGDTCYSLHGGWFQAEPEKGVALLRGVPDAKATATVPVAQIDNCVRRSHLQQGESVPRLVLGPAIRLRSPQFGGENAYYFAHSRKFEIPEDAKIIAGPGLVTGGPPELLQDGGAELIKEEEKILWIKDYAWAEAGGKVKVYVDCDFLPEDAQEDIASATFDTRSFVLDIASQQRRRLKVEKLHAEIKPEECKVLFGCFKRKLRSDVKVAQLVGYVSEQAAYHHGEMSLSETIVGMAQDFVGSNNINLLVPQGQFGTRLQGGKDSASARYIYTRLAPITRFLFPASDDPVLEYLSEDGMSIEPRWYCPVIPMVLVNGVEGIGTGWSSSVPNFNPRDIIENLRRWLKKQEMKEMTPWFAGFTGSISKSREEGKWEVTGNIRNLGEGRAEITELPVKRWTQDYREILEENLPKGEKKREGPKLLEDYQEYHSEKSVHFVLSLSSEGQLHADKVFKLRSSISMNNMMLFDADGKIKKYDTPKDILQDFAQVRLKMYETRKAYLLARLTRECEVLSAKARFVKLVIEGRIVIRKRKIADLAQDLRKHGFKALRDLQGEQSEEKEVMPRSVVSGKVVFRCCHCLQTIEEEVEVLLENCYCSRACLKGGPRQLDGSCIATPAWVMPPPKNAPIPLGRRLSLQELPVTDFSKTEAIITPTSHWLHRISKTLGEALLRPSAWLSEFLQILALGFGTDLTATIADGRFFLKAVQKRGV